jgi:hypothetical protein
MKHNDGGGMKHTPWTIDADLDGEVPSIYITGSDGELIAEIGGARTYGMEHAQAIVVVDEMLEALIDARRRFTKYEIDVMDADCYIPRHHKDFMEKTKSIIERATGKKIEEVVG